MGDGREGVRGERVGEERYGSVRVEGGSCGKGGREWEMKGKE